MKTRYLFSIFGLTIFQTYSFTTEASGQSHQECVVLLHGLGRTSLSMKRLEWTLARKGYQVINLSYPSRRFSVEQLAEEDLHRVISEEISTQISQIHFVTHSMGGIILRQYLSNHTIKNLGRLVMLAPPNQGSEVADKLKRGILGRWILGPGGCELGTASTDLPKRLGAVDFGPGIIAGDRSLNPWFSRILPGPDDGKVSVESTKLEGMSELLVMHSGHTWLMWRAETVRHILAYLKTGIFNDDGSAHE